MQLADSLYITILVFAALVQLALLIFTNLQIDMSKQTKLFRWLIICSISICFADVLTRIVALYQESDSFMRSLSYMCNEIYFALQVCVSSIWFAYAQREIHASWRENTLKLVLCLIPMAFLLIFIMLTGATGWLFSIGASNRYQRGMLFALHPIVCMLYLVIPAASAIQKIRKKEYFLQRNKLVTIMLFAAVVLPFVVLQVVLGSDFPLFCLGYTLALLVLFVNRQNQRITIDELTGVSNRSQAMRYLSYKMNAPAEPGQAIKSLYVLMVDIDKFKHINDTFGHVEGDEALKRTASVLKRSVPRSYFIGRYGGDEFIIVGEASREEEVQQICETIRENIEIANYQAMLPYNFTVSIGYSVRNGQITSIPDFVKMADQNLYRMKKNKTEAKAQAK